MKTVTIFLLFFCSFFLQGDEFTSISLSELSTIDSEEKIEVRGFIYRAKNGVAILAPQPNLKSCCIGTSKKTHEQIVLKDMNSPELPTQAVSVRGIFYFDSKNGQNYLIKTELIKKKGKYPLTILTFIGILLFSVFLFKKITNTKHN